MEIETKYQLAKLDPPEVVETPDVVASEVVVAVPSQVEQVVEPVVVEQILDPIPEEPAVKKRGRKKKWSNRSKAKWWRSKKGSGNQK